MTRASWAVRFGGIACSRQEREAAAVIIADATGAMATACPRQRAGHEASDNARPRVDRAASTPAPGPGASGDASTDRWRFSWTAAAMPACDRHLPACDSRLAPADQPSAGASATSHSASASGYWTNDQGAVVPRRSPWRSLETDRRPESPPAGDPFLSSQPHSTHRYVSPAAACQ